MRSIILLCLFLITITGCTVIADLKSYETDRGCDLNMELLDFSAHAGGPHRIEFQVVRPEDEEAGIPTDRLAAIAILDPTPSANFDLELLNAIPSRDHEIRFYADVNGNRTVDASPSDHTWILTEVCEPQPIPFTHVFEFQDFEEPTPIGSDLIVRFANIPEGGAFELHVTIKDTPDPTQPTETLERSIGLYRLQTRTNTLIIDGSGIASAFDVTIPGIIDSGVDYTFEVWADADDDSEFDDEDGHWRIEVGGLELSMSSDEAPYIFDVMSDDIVGQVDHSGFIAVTILPNSTASE